MDATTQTETVNLPVQQNQRYNCSKCKRAFATTSALGRHTKDKHSAKQNLSALHPNPVLTDIAFYKPTYKPDILEEHSCP